MNFKTGYRGLGNDLPITFKFSGVITKGTHEGQLVSMDTNDTVKLAVANDHIFGTISSIEKDVVTIKVRGAVEVSYDSGNAPVVGSNLLAVGASASTIKTVATGTDTNRLQVLSKDVTAETCWLLLG